MSLDKTKLLLYAVTDRQWLNGSSLPGQVEQAILGGATFIQLREKNMAEEQFLKEALEIKQLCKKHGVPFVVNDSVDVALRSDADGVHVGQSDMAAKNVRQLIGNNRLLGVSAQTVEQALIAQAGGADYIGVGAVFATATKPDADCVGMDTLKAICKAVSIPVIAIGGIDKTKILQLCGTGVCGAAVISAIFAQNDVKAAAIELKALAKRAFGKNQAEEDMA